MVSIDNDMAETYCRIYQLTEDEIEIRFAILSISKENEKELSDKELNSFSFLMLFLRYFLLADLLF